MQSSDDQIAKIKALLDSGFLNQEEFDAAKRRILEAVDAQPQSERMTPPPFPSKKKEAATNKHLKWLIFGGVGAFVVIIGIFIAFIATSGSSDSSDSDGSSEYVVADEYAIASDSDFQEEPGDGLSLFNPWRKEYFTNEWDEPDPSKPKLYATIGDSYWGIRIEYIPSSSEVPMDVFRFLITKDGEVSRAYGPIEILVRGSDGETKIVEVDDERDYPAYITDPAVVNALKYFIDHEKFDIRINFGIWNERHSAKGEWSAEPGSLQEAIDKLL